MSPILQLRKRVFGISQAELADIAKTSQGTVSKWESGELEPDREQLALIRSEAQARGLDWSDAWFFEPAPAEGARA
jgi:DNA-binding transcriptional regulator YiaG